MKEQKIENIKWVARISGAFSIIVAILLIVNYIQIKSHSPVENKALESIVAQLKNDPNNHDLMEAVRNLDLIARKAWFTAQWQLNTGALLLIIGSIVCFGSLRWLSKHFAIIGEPEEKTTTGDTQKQTQSVITSYSIHYTKLYDITARIHCIVHTNRDRSSRLGTNPQQRYCNRLPFN